MHMLICAIEILNMIIIIIMFFVCGICPSINFSVGMSNVRVILFSIYF